MPWVVGHLTDSHVVARRHAPLVGERPAGYGSAGYAVQTAVNGGSELLISVRPVGALAANGVER
jgi:hypothetical protein